MRIKFLIFIFSFLVCDVYSLHSEDIESRRVLFMMTKLEIGGAEQAFINMIN